MIGMLEISHLQEINGYLMLGWPCQEKVSVRSAMTFLTSFGVKIIKDTETVLVPIFIRKVLELKLTQVGYFQKAMRKHLF